jgi:hypothetical protein
MATSLLHIMKRDANMLLFYHFQLLRQREKRFFVVLRIMERNRKEKERKEDSVALPGI